MRSVNKVILIGNLTRDPEVRQTPNNQTVCTFGIATNRQWTAKDGGSHSSAEFHELVAWANLAEICGKYLKKGKLIYIEGYLKTRSWDTPEGIRRHKTEVIVQDMIMLEKKSNNDSETDFSSSVENLEQSQSDSNDPMDDGDFSFDDNTESDDTPKDTASSDDSDLPSGTVDF
jgi:single-strand DNA-binding protein